MALTDDFRNALAKQAPKITNDNTIELHCPNASWSLYTIFNYMTRIVSVTGQDGKLSCIPFDRMDRDVLENVREYMCENGKSPLPLPDIKEASGFLFDKSFNTGT